MRSMRALSRSRATEHLEGVRAVAQSCAQQMNLAEDGAERVADLVRDAGGQSADARQLLGADELRLVLEQRAP